MCFDTCTTASNPGRTSGVCTLLENAVGRNLLWMARWHQMSVLLSSNLFGVCLGPSARPEIILFRILWESWTRLKYHLVQQEQPILLPASESVKTCIMQHCQKVYPRDDDRDFINVVALMVGFDINVMHRARWIARFMYSMKIELLH